jgi:diguanylate cyclase (GGDEF)-like protein
MKGFAVLATIICIAIPKLFLTEVAFSFLYVIPVGLGTWWFGYRIGLTIAIFCTSLSGVMNYHLQFQSAENLHSLYLNTTLRFFVFLGFSIFVQMFQWELKRQMKMAETDSRTDLLNVRGFFDMAQKRLEEAREQKEAVGMLYFDLDHFKEVNDKLGHMEGDRVLQTVALAMKTCFRSPDLIGRFGGDEFLVFLSKVNTAELDKKLKEFRQHLDGRMQASNWPVTFSIGCVVYLDPPGSLEKLIHFAESLAYEVKNQGRNGLKLEFR